MQSSTTKKIVVRRFDRESIPGFAYPASLLQANSVEILLVSGVAQQVPYADIKSIAFVKDFDPPRGQTEQKQFQSRPKIEGLWVKMRYRDGEVGEGLLLNNLATLENAGFYITPPNSSGNVHRLFIPRAALEEMVVLAVVGGKTARARSGEKLAQIELFSETS